MGNLIYTENLTKKFGTTTVVNNLNITINERDIYGFLGPNGSGKSTTIKMLLGLVGTTQGKAFINGFDVSKERQSALEKIGAMVEAPKFYDGLSGYKNIQLMANLYGVPKQRVEDVLELVGLSEHKHKKVSNYSLGMKQRLGIARAFLNNPSLVILDEPTNGLDPQGVIEIRSLIRELSEREKVTFILCSHILSEVQTLCNRVGIIYKGNLLVEGEVNKLLSNEYEVYEILTNEKNKAQEVLSNVKEVLNMDQSNSGLVLKVKKGLFNEINKILVLNNINIINIKNKETTLEDYFLKVIGDEKI